MDLHAENAPCWHVITDIGSSIYIFQQEVTLGMPKDSLCGFHNG